MPPAVEIVHKGAALPFAGGRLVAAPYQFVTTGEENLRVVSANSKAGVRLKIQGLRLSERGENVPFVHDHIPNSDRSVAQTEHALGVGALLHLTVFATGATPLQGQTFVMVQVIRGVGAAALVLGTLLAGYVTSTQALGWPGSPIQSSTSGEPVVRAISGTAPGAGLDFGETCPAGARWEVLRVMNTLITAGGGAGRAPQLRAVQSGVRMVTVDPAFTQAPASTSDWMWAPNLPMNRAPVTTVAQQPLPDRLMLNAGDFFFSSTVALAAGDVWGQPMFVVREWLEVP